MTRRSIGLDRASACMLGGALAFAFMGTFAHALKPRCDWLVVAAVRTLMMFLTASALATLAGAKLVVWRPRTLWLRSLAGSVSLVCNFYAFANLPVADAMTFMNVHPLWIVLITAVGARKLPALSEEVGIVCGLAGVVLIEGPHFGSGGDRLAAAAALLSSVSTAVAMLGLNRLKAIDGRAVVAHFAGVATVVSVIWLVARRDSLAPIRLDPMTLLLLLGVGVSGTIGQVLLTKAYTAGQPSKVAVVGLTQVVFAMAFDVALWGRAMTPTILMGFALVLGPTTWLAVRSASKPKPGDVEAELAPIE